MHANALANYKNDIKYINATCSTCITSEKTIDRTSNESLFSRQWDMNQPIMVHRMMICQNMLTPK
ncbi:hypothetical protein ACVNP1_08185 [Staphylococcus aureus]